MVRQLNDGGMLHLSITTKYKQETTPELLKCITLINI